MLSPRNPINRYRDQIVTNYLQSHTSKQSHYLNHVKEILTHYDFLQHLTEADQSLLLQHIKIVRYFHQQVIYPQNHLSQDINFILTGAIKLGWNTLEGQYHTELFMPAGTLINIVSVLSEQPLIYEHTAQGETVLANLPADVFCEVLQRNPKAQFSILKLICSRAHNKRANVIFDSTQSLLTRLCQKLIFLVDYHADHLNIKLNQASFAELLHTTRQKINKEFSYLVDLKVIEVKYNRIEILDYAKLKQLAQSSEQVPLNEFF